MSQNTFFTSDHHFGHKNIIQYSNRPYRSLEDMHSALIKYWNSVVRPTDIVYHLGDIALVGRDSHCDIESIVNALNGNIYYILGNHDKDIQKISKRFQWVRNYAEIKIADEDANNGRQDITLCHYAARVWNKSHYGAWMLYGHSHGSLPDDPNALSIDVGVDCHNYTPLSYAQVKSIMSKKVFKPIDHHGAREFEKSRS